jgi:HEAT repeat protein
MRCMVQIGPEALWLLVGALTNSQSSSRHRQSAAWGIGTMESNAAPAIPLLIGCLRDEKSGTAICAATALGRMKIEPAIVVPALTESLGSSNQDMRRIVADFLPNFGNDARMAIPKLVSMLVDPDFTVRQGVTNALQKIAPEVLKTNGVSGDPHFRF